MKYMGSKNRIAKYILPIMLSERKEGQCWVEPFVGGGNMIDKVDGWRIGFDINENVIAALITIRDRVNLLPKNNKDFNESDYLKMKNGEWNYQFKGFAGFAYSFGAKWLSSFRKDSLNKRDYVEEAYKNALKQNSKLQGVKLINESYLNIKIPKNSLIYCDPPYQNTSKYKGNKHDFDHNLFWDWCRNMTKDGHVVFVSEYNAPDDFECLYKKEIYSSLSKNTRSKKCIEKLFRYKGKIMDKNEYKCLICEAPVATFVSHIIDGIEQNPCVCGSACTRALMDYTVGNYEERRVKHGIDKYVEIRDSVEVESLGKNVSKPKSRSCSHILEWCVNRLVSVDNVDMNVVNEIEGVIVRLKT